VLEHCFRCLSHTPAGDPLRSPDWLALVAREGEYLGIVCVGCVADEEIALIELEALYEIAA
jgi:hypothetical protein